MRLFRLKAKEQNNPINCLLLIMVKVYHGNVIYRTKMCFSSHSASKLYQSLSVKWL